MKTALPFLMLSSMALAGSNSLCTSIDQRVPYQDSRIGRVTGKYTSNCTVTLISDSCAITAGHCHPSLYGASIEFDVPLSDGMTIRHASPENTFGIHTDSILSQDKGLGQDWAIIRLLPNAVTNELPGKSRGYFPVSFETPEASESIFVAGFGKVYDLSSNLQGTLQIHSGSILSVHDYQYKDPSTGATGRKVKILEHDVDTLGGNSGSAIIRTSDQSIVGIHTHGGICTSTAGNRGTLISEHPELQAAITACLSN